MGFLVRLGLLSRILLALVVVGLLPLGVTVIGLVGMNRDAMTEQVLRTHTVATRGTSARIASFLDARSAAIESAMRILAADPAGPTGQGALAALLEARLGFVGIIILDDTGREVVRAQRKSLSETIDRLLQVPVDATGMVVLPAADSEVSRWLRIDRPLGAVGTLLTIVDLKPLVDQISPRELGPHAALSVANLEGNLILGAEGVQGFDPEMVTLAQSGRAFGAGRYGTSEGATIGAYASVPGYPWVVLSRQPASVAEATARRLRDRSLMAVLLAVGLLSIAVTLAHRTLVRPIRELLEDQQSLIGLRNSPVTVGRSEISQLRDSFRILADRIRSRDELGEVFLGRYQVLDLIGEGAMGSVFRGWDPTLQRPVALKTVRFDRTGGDETNQLAGQLLSEASNVAQFTHPNIVAVHDVQEAPDVAFLALEFVEGISLAQFFESRAPLEGAAVVQVGLGIARGLEAAHERGIVHHDIKPANVLLGYDGSLKIVDFGVSRTIASAQSDGEFVVGTPGFIAPEAIQGQGYGPAADLFALGVVLYQAATGQKPFVGKTVREILVDTVQREPPPPSKQLPGVPAALDDLILALLRKKPDERVQSATQVLAVLESLEEVLGGATLLDSRITMSPWESQATAILGTQGMVVGEV